MSGFDLDDNQEAPDTNDPQQAVEYANDIFRTMHDKEVGGGDPPGSPLTGAQTELLPAVDYMPSQPQINHKMRSILVDWLIEVHHKFRLRYETLYITVRLLDLFLSKQVVCRDKLQLVGVTALMIASKYEEIFAPEVGVGWVGARANGRQLGDFVYICDSTYSNAEILQMEETMLRVLEFRITFATPATFLKRFARAANADTTAELLARFLLELLLVEPMSVTARPSHVAAAVMALATHAVSNSPWSSNLARVARVEENELASLSAQIRDCLAQAQNHPLRLRAVMKKYSTERFQSISTRFTSL